LNGVGWKTEEHTCEVNLSERRRLTLARDIAEDKGHVVISAKLFPSSLPDGLARFILVNVNADPSGMVIVTDRACALSWMLTLELTPVVNLTQTVVKEKKTT